MGNVVFIKTDTPNAVSISDGQIIFDTSGTGKIYIDENGERKETGGAKSVDDKLNVTSSNAIQNKVVSTQVSEINSRIGSANVSINNLSNQLNGLGFVVLTEAEYEQLSTKNPNVIYICTEE